MRWSMASQPVRKVLVLVLIALAGCGITRQMLTPKDISPRIIAPGEKFYLHLPAWGSDDSALPDGRAWVTFNDESEGIPARLSPTGDGSAVVVGTFPGANDYPTITVSVLDPAQSGTTRIYGYPLLSELIVVTEHLSITSARLDPTDPAWVVLELAPTPTPGTSYDVWFVSSDLESLRVRSKSVLTSTNGLRAQLPVADGTELADLSVSIRSPRGEEARFDGVDVTSTAPVSPAAAIVVSVDPLVALPHAELTVTLDQELSAEDQADLRVAFEGHEPTPPLRFNSPTELVTVMPEGESGFAPFQLDMPDRPGRPFTSLRRQVPTPIAPPALPEISAINPDTGRPGQEFRIQLSSAVENTDLPVSVHVAGVPTLDPRFIDAQTVAATFLVAGQLPVGRVDVIVTQDGYDPARASWRIAPHTLAITGIQPGLVRPGDDALIAVGGSLSAVDVTGVAFDNTPVVWSREADGRVRVTVPSDARDRPAIHVSSNDTHSDTSLGLGVVRIVSAPLGALRAGDNFSLRLSLPVADRITALQVAGLAAPEPALADYVLQARIPTDVDVGDSVVEFRVGDLEFTFPIEISPAPLEIVSLEPAPFIANAYSLELSRVLHAPSAATVLFDGIPGQLRHDKDRPRELLLLAPEGAYRFATVELRIGDETASLTRQRPSTLR